MRINEAINVATGLIRADIIPMWQGATGIGKSDAIAQVAKAIDHDLLVIYPALYLPENFLGFPMMDPSGKAGFQPMGFLAQILQTEKPLLVFLDEIDKASHAVQCAVAQLILSRTINGDKIPDVVKFAMAGNRPEDRCGGQRLVKHLDNRCWKCTIDVDADAWLRWASENNVHPMVQAFISRFPQHIEDSDPTRKDQQDTTPRSLTKLASYMTATGSDRLPLEVAEGFISKGVAVEFSAFCRLADEIPSYEEIVQDPFKTLIPENPSSRYAVASMLAVRGDLADKEPIAVYLSRLSAEVSAFAFKSLFKRDPKFSESKTFGKWCVDHADLFR